jgi:hypothetical protein
VLFGKTLWGGSGSTNTYVFGALDASTRLVTPAAKTEVITLVDSPVVRNIGKVLNDSITVTESIKRALARTALSDTYSITDISIARSLARAAIPDSLSLTDAISRSTTSVHAESFTLVETVTKYISRAYTETFTVLDSISKALVRTAFSESISVTDSITKSAGKSLSETFTLVDSISKALVRTTFSESFTVTESISKNLSRAYTETFVATDSISKSAGRSYTETISITESIKKSLTRSWTELNLFNGELFLWADYYHAIVDSITISDLGLSKILTHAITDSITVTDSITKSYVRLPAIETFTLVDSITKSISRAYTESFTVTESITKYLIRASIAETISVTDSIAKSIPSVHADSLTVTESFSKSASKAAFIETFTLVDSITKYLSRAYAETLTLLDSETKLDTRSAFSETFTLVDSITKTAAKSFTLSFIVTDSISRSLVAFRYFSDVSSIVDSISLNRKLTLNDYIYIAVPATSANLWGTADWGNNLFGIGLQQTWNFGCLDSITKMVGKANSETVTLYDSYSRHAVVALYFTDADIITDSITKADARSNLVDSLPVADLGINRAIRHGILDLNLLRSENFGGWNDNCHLLLDGYSITDSITRSLNVYRPLDVISIVDVIAKSNVKSALIENINLTDIVNKLVSRPILDSTNLTDSVKKLTGYHRSDAYSIVDLTTIRAIGHQLTSLIPVADTVSKATSRNLLSSVLSITDWIDRYALTHLGHTSTHLFVSLDADIVTDQYQVVLTALGRAVRWFSVKPSNLIFALPNRIYEAAQTPNNYWSARAVSHMISNILKNPGSNELFQVNWQASLMTTGTLDPIATSTWTVSSGPDSALTITSSFATSTQAFVQLSGGTLGGTYTVTDTIVTVSGQTKVEVLQIVVKS